MLKPLLLKHNTKVTFCRVNYIESNVHLNEDKAKAVNSMREGKTRAKANLSAISIERVMQVKRSYYIIRI